MFNDILVHENVEVTGPTRGPEFSGEKPLGPLVIQGDHGAVALRRISYQRYDPEVRLAVEGLADRFRSADFSVIGAHDNMGSFPGHAVAMKGALHVEPK